VTGDRRACLVQRVGNGLEGLSSNSSRGEQFFSSTKLPDLHWAHKTSYSMDTGVFTKVKAAVA
jgi:hypothetical protein